MRDVEGQTVPDEKIEEVEERISSLPREKVDELFYRVGFTVVKSSEDSPQERKYKRIDNKALTPHQLSEIKKGKSSVPNTMLEETPFEMVIVNLRELEGKEPNGRDKLFHKVRESVSAMSPEEMDSFFHDLDHEMARRDKGSNKALTPEAVQDIKTGYYYRVDSLLCSTDYDTVLKELKKRDRS